MKIYVDFTYGYNFSYKGTFRAGLSLAFFLKNKLNKEVICLCASKKDKEYILSQNLEVKYISLSSNKYIRNLSRILIFYYLQIIELSSSFIFVGTFNPLAPFKGISLLHDLYIIDMPQVYGFFQRLFYKFFVINSALNSSKIIVLSETLSNRVKILFKKTNLFVYRYSPNLLIKKKIHKKANTILIVLKNTKNKNSFLIYEVFKEILKLNKEEKWEFLAVTSDIKEFKRIEDSLEIPSNKIKYFTNISDEHLQTLFKQSQIYLTLSQVEGFGLSTRMAILNECIVVTPNQKIHKEASWNLGIYLENFKPQYIAEVIIKASSTKRLNNLGKIVKEKFKNDEIKNCKELKSF